MPTEPNEKHLSKRKKWLMVSKDDDSKRNAGLSMVQVIGKLETVNFSEVSLCGPSLAGSSTENRKNKVRDNKYRQVT